jgi:hypothetical protein
MADIPLKLSTLIDYVDDSNAGPLDKLEAAYNIAGTLSDQADHLIGHFVDQARRSGASWTEIGARMGGVTKQAARKRFTVDLGDYEEMTKKAFGRYTTRARQAIVAAQEAAREHHHHYIGTEHILLGVLAEREGLAVKAVEACGVTADGLREAVVARLGEPSEEVPERIAFTGKSKKVLELTLREALRFGHNYIGTEHLLLGLIAEDSGLAAEVLRGQGLTDERVRAELERMFEEMTATPGAG